MSIFNKIFGKKPVAKKIVEKTTAVTAGVKVRFCKGCNEWKPLDAFSDKVKRKTKCKKCNANYQKTYNELHNSTTIYVEKSIRDDINVIVIKHNLSSRNEALKMLLKTYADSTKKKVSK